ncbi:CAMK/CDPK protein kinase [Plasmodium yoelii 17X]|uniref:Calcium-dependent protein kinase 3 n=3 Tax=Plasmodium yoelii TaxID=5861 RepID=A0AAE9WRT3_PLAYO|nr:calcium-dependent protein kinase 3 [Plasmodium yoelii]ETB59158.1 CAMK/CDPK protein kinase [Plasmodium yoelii 17X]WBY55313.1 calcium-dependent protein kinase 3 [Plasmodium yoelii yoelii]CDU16485.1 calcium-dependent protein kinase 3 [Plasmodium yoelii]VTZ73310.1 calcium-dependent protein kinase 3 [Plasmodium yoelii]|eukprot:XP_022811556.1 calcium-dependent protein kinase 3 [Plasmodium yoelii]
MNQLCVERSPNISTATAYIKGKPKKSIERIKKKKDSNKSIKSQHKFEGSKISNKNNELKDVKSKDPKNYESYLNKNTKHKDILLKSKRSDNFKFSRRGFILSFTGNLEDFYNLSEEPLGKGTYGCVYKATDKLLKIQRAVKVVSKKKLKNIPRFRQEIDIMKNLDHPNVIKLLETFEDEEQIYLIMDLCTGGELFDKIIKKGSFVEMYASFIMKQIFSVLNYLHIRNICHRDIKPENFLFYDKSTESLIKIIDFGLAAYFNDIDYEMKTKAGTPYYVAPQVLTGCYDYKCDLWSAGVLFYIILCGYPPFYGESDHEILSMVKKGKYNFKGKEWNNISDEAKDLIKRCLTIDSGKRINASEALKHPWFKKKKGSFNLDVKMDIHVLENFKNYALLLKLQKLAMTIIAQQSNDYDLQQLKAVFLYLDEDGKGNITKNQLKKGLENSGLKLPQNFDVLLDQIDSDGSGRIDYTEFLAAALDRKHLSKKLIYCAFRVFDVDNDGEITTAELAHILYNGNKKGSITQKDVNQVKKMIQEVDKNNDGKIDFYEFCEMMKLKY